MPIASPTFMDWPRPPEGFGKDVEASVQADIEAGVVMDVGARFEGDIELSVGETVVGVMEEPDDSVERVKEEVRLLVARMLLTTLSGMGACPGCAHLPTWLSQHVVFTSFSFRGQYVPSAQALSCTESFDMSMHM